jgi:hypothetical protein
MAVNLAMKGFVGFTGCPPCWHYQRPQARQTIFPDFPLRGVGAGFILRD